MKSAQSLAWIKPGISFSSLKDNFYDSETDRGPIAASQSLNMAMLLDAYREGIFTWSAAFQPLLWWSPNPRMIRRCDEFKQSRSLGKRIRGDLNQGLKITSDTVFDKVIAACSEPRSNQDGTWITPQIMKTYCELHNNGFAHSVEVWGNGDLIGGLYLVSIGAMVFGESMFSKRTDASKIALNALVIWLKNNGGHMIDCQQETRHLSNLGGRAIVASDFRRISKNLMQSQSLPWKNNPLSEKLLKISK